MIEKLYGKYFQKSRAFLYPILGIKRTSATAPNATYVSLDGLIPPEDMKLVCVYPINDSEAFKAFESQMLTGNPLFEEKLQIKDNNIYIFNLEGYKLDWFNFMLGKYSKLSTQVKRAIKQYYGERSNEYKYIESYLYPEKYFEIYANLLEVDVSTLENLGELCDPCDLEKETLKIPVEYLELLTKIE
jgi:hypothetical protein